jgi:DNA-binding NarL/FixJ family response regulator
LGKKTKQTLANIGAVLRAADTALPNDVADPAHHKRQLVADLCRLLGASANTPPGQRPDRSRPLMPSLSPRMRQTLERLLAGDSEKQIASRLGASRHTVHVYVKALYRSFGVCSRGELLSRFVQPPRFNSPAMR